MAIDPDDLPAEFTDPWFDEFKAAWDALVAAANIQEALVTTGRLSEANLETTIEAEITAAPFIQGESHETTAIFTWGEVTTDYIPDLLPANLAAPSSAVIPRQESFPSLDGAGHIDPSHLPDDVLQLVDGEIPAEYLPPVPSSDTNPIRTAALPGVLYNSQNQNSHINTLRPMVTLADGTQYVVWEDGSRSIRVGKRMVGSADWEEFDLGTLAGNPLAVPVANDGHNNTVIERDALGYLHISGNHHGSPLHYVRSVNPDDITSWTAPGMVGDEGLVVSYPQFLTLPSGEMLFFFRQGGASDGELKINAYNATTQVWTRRVHLLTGADPGNSTNWGTYINSPCVDGAGNIHVFFLWRPASNDPAGAVDIGHVTSTDSGVTWKQMGGTVMPTPISKPANAPYAVQPGNVLGALNQSGAAVTANGIPWAIFWMNVPDAGGDGFGLVTFRWSGSAWVRETIFNTGQNMTLSLYPAPNIFTWVNRVFALYCAEPLGNSQRTVWISELTPDSTTPVLPFPLLSGPLRGYVPTIDTPAINVRGELNMLVTPTGTYGEPAGISFTKQWGNILTLDLVRLSEVGDTLRPAMEEIIISPTSLIVSAGTAVAAPASGRPAITLPDAETSEVSGWINIPAHWREAIVELWWTKITAVTGDVVFTTRYGVPKEGNFLDRQQVLANVTEASATAASTIEITTLGSINLPKGLPVLPFLAVGRAGTDAADTLASGIRVLAIKLIQTL